VLGRIGEGEGVLSTGIYLGLYSMGKGRQGWGRVGCAERGHLSAYMAVMDRRDNRGKAVFDLKFLRG
jgi:hypothetical protein